MEAREKDEIRNAVRDRYGKVAQANQANTGLSAAACCAPAQTIQIEGRPGEAAMDASCCGPSVISEEQLKRLSEYMGYSKEDLESVPPGANMSLGCGNPVALASLEAGETVVDLGSGGGFDCFLASKEVGDTGQVIGVDMTSDMISLARGNVEKMGTSNVEFRLGEIEHLPVADNTANIIMSNCVINLSPDKKQVYGDAFRVLKPGGRLAISDVLATAELPDEVRQDLNLVSACIGGAATIDDTRAMLAEIGFQDIKIIPNDKSRELISAWNPDRSSNPGDYVLSAYIEAIKPS
jgi:arsenite methyltransferase